MILPAVSLSRISPLRGGEHLHEVTAGSTSTHLEPEAEVRHDIEVDGSHTLEDFHEAIFDGFDRWDSHACEFITRSTPTCSNGTRSATGQRGRPGETRRRATGGASIVAVGR
ncbi:hypothetical protein BRC67_02595 [Halobacteriales archaeon QH_3_68_24]|nr:MAG: hypothetical protein BRC67_02595 [Halobacteriales archaeon QH_3_68_24]